MAQNLRGSETIVAGTVTLTLEIEVDVANDEVTLTMEGDGVRNGNFSFGFDTTVQASGTYAVSWESVAGLEERSLAMRSAGSVL